MSEPAAFLEGLYAGVETGWLTLLAIDAHTGDRQVAWAPAATPARLVDTAVRLTPSCDVWYGVATRTDRLDGGRRGGDNDCAAIPALWLDVDIAGPHHAATDLPPDRAAADMLVAQLGPRPSAVVDTGGGLHAYWCLDEAAAVDDARPVLAAWGATWTRLARGHGWRLDNVWDVARVLRLPGTVNRKVAAEAVTVDQADFTRRYGLDDLASVLDAPPAPPRAVTGRVLPYVGPERPGDAFNACHRGGDVLARLGFARARVHANGDEHWVRPGKDARAGTSATVYGDDGHTTVWSDTCAATWPTLVVRRPYDPFGLYVATLHGGDFAAAAAELAKDGYGDHDDLSWARLDGTGTGGGDGDGNRHDEALTDLGNARRLVAAHGPDLRYVPELGWLAWDGARWAIDRTGEVHRRAVAVVDGLKAEVLDAPDAPARRKRLRHWERSQAAGRIDAMVAVGQYLPGVPVGLEALDADPWVLNVVNGTLDLRSGRLVAHSRRRLITKLAPVVYDPDATAPRWEQFLMDIFDGDVELIGFVRRLVGCSLTGDVSEHRFPIAYGPGGNGKSTFLNTVKGILGDYATSLPASVLTHAGQSQHPTALMGLRGARLALSMETEQDQRLAEVLIKQLTGGDEITARYMRRDFVSFKPTAKLWVAANHLPKVRGTDEAIWRRLLVVPFTVTFDDDRRDLQLGERLAGEAPGILAWAVRGCVEWQRGGLNVPERVRAATGEYRREEDHIGRFLSDCFVVADGGVVASSVVRARYEAWCDELGEPRWTTKAVGLELKRRGFEPIRIDAGHTRAWRGFSLGGAEGISEDNSLETRRMTPPTYLHIRSTRARALEGNEPTRQRCREASRPDQQQLSTGPVDDGDGHDDQDDDEW